MLQRNLYDEIVRQRGSLEKLVARLPGFKGYHEKNARRHADTMLREHLTTQMQQLLDRFIGIENDILDDGRGLQHMSKTRVVKSTLQAYIDRVDTSNPKYSGMFDAIKVDNDALDRVYAFDEAQTVYIDRLGHSLDQLAAAVDSGIDFSDALENFHELAKEANDAYDLRDLEITKLAL